VAASRAARGAQRPEIDIERLVFIHEIVASTQDGTPLRPVRTRPALRRTRSIRPLEDNDLRRRTQGDRHDRPRCSTAQWTAFDLEEVLVPTLRSAISC
jgi:hypothetical protein